MYLLSWEMSCEQNIHKQTYGIRFLENIDNAWTHTCLYKCVCEIESWLLRKKSTFCISVKALNGLRYDNSCIVERIRPLYKQMILQYYSISFQLGTRNESYTVAEIHFGIALTRKPLYYILNTIIPSVVLAVLSTLTFLVPNDSGEKLSMGVAILLAFTVFMLILSDITPQTSDNPPLLGKQPMHIHKRMEETFSIMMSWCLLIHMHYSITWRFYWLDL